jgi:hypothetical protein
MDEKKTTESEVELAKVFTEAQERRLVELIRIELKREHQEAYGDDDGMI